MDSAWSTLVVPSLAHFSSTNCKVDSFVCFSLFLLKHKGSLHFCRIKFAFCSSFEIWIRAPGFTPRSDLGRCKKGSPSFSTASSSDVLQHLSYCCSRAYFKRSKKLRFSLFLAGQIRQHLFLQHFFYFCYGLYFKARLGTHLKTFLHNISFLLWCACLLIPPSHLRFCERVVTLGSKVATCDALYDRIRRAIFD